MSVVLELEPKVEEALKKKAVSKGLTFQDYVTDLISKDILIDELLAPVRKQFEESQMTEEELDDFFNDIREQAFKERYPNGRP